MSYIYIQTNLPLRRLSITESNFEKIVENNQQINQKFNSFKAISPPMNGFPDSIQSQGYRPPNKVAPIEYHKNGIKMPNNKQEFEVSWHNLSYTLTKIPFVSKERRVILKKVSGYFSSSEVTAIMGPSGAGKSTLLEIICGRRKVGVEGEIRIRGVNELKVGFVPQDNHLLELLTVRETFIFSSQLINYNLKPSDHNIIAAKLIQRFGLETIIDTKAKRCSGGQRKRLSIALEVLSKPNLLILDEPTTGLDSPSCNHVMNILHELVSDKEKPVAIVTTIHQPSVATFTAFNKIYILTSLGKLLYQGMPKNLVPTMGKLGITMDRFTSPADYIIEIAANDYGPEPIKKLCSDAKGKDMEHHITAGTQTLASASKLVSHPFWKHFKILFIRSQVILYRDPFLTFLRIVMALFCSISLALIFGRKVGTVSGCAPRELELYATPIHVLSKKFENDLNMIMQNVCMLFLGIMVGFISGLTPTLLNFPKEMHVFYKEYHNGWYSCITYYLAKVLSDIPLQVITPVIYIVIVQFWTGQPPEPIRFIGLMSISIVLSFLAQSIGECTSAIWMENQNAAVFAGGLIPLPMILFGGFLVTVDRMPAYLRPFSWGSFLRFAFEAMLVSTYGFDRCTYSYNQFLKTINASAVVKPLWAQSLPLLLEYVDRQRGKDIDDDHEMTEEDSLKRLYSVFGGSIIAEGEELDLNKSMILSYYKINDFQLYTSMAILIVYMIGLKIMTYYVLLLKLHSKR